jgi:hypothetical protein
LIETNPQVVCNLIELAREFHAQQNVTIDDEPEGLGHDPEASFLEAHASDPILDEFRSVIADLAPQEQQQVVALLWLGRGDYELDEWNDAVEYAADAWTPSTADYLIAHPMLAEYLTIGLEQHGHSCQDFERIVERPRAS